MSLKNKLKKKLKNLLRDMLPDSIYLKRKFKKKMGKPLDLKNPKTFNEKLQWLKLQTRIVYSLLKH